MAENPTLGLDSASLSFSCELGGRGEMGTQEIPISDQRFGFQGRSEKCDGFVVDMERFSHGTDKNITANSRITQLQRSFSRKGSQLGGERSNSSTIPATERETTAADVPQKAILLENCILEKPVIVPFVVVGDTRQALISQEGQITITTSNAAENKCSRRYSGRRNPSSWVLDPRKILFFFATLSSMGTILLIYFTLSIGKYNGDDSSRTQYS